MLAFITIFVCSPSSSCFQFLNLFFSHDLRKLLLKFINSVFQATSMGKSGKFIAVACALFFIGCIGYYIYTHPEYLSVDSSSGRAVQTTAAETKVEAKQTETTQTEQPNNTSAANSSLEDKVSGEITITSWNMKQLGQSKLNKTQVMSYVINILGRSDINAMQEITSKEQTVMPSLVDLLKKQGKNYDFVISERLGRTNTKEQYVFLYDKSTIEYVANSAYVVADPDDRMHREPFVASFKTKGGTFDFTLIDVHTDPDETEQELNYLDEVYTGVQNSDPNENDVIMLGDFNEPGTKFYELGKVPNIRVMIVDDSIKTNTRNTAQFDNIVFDSNTLSEYTNQFNVFNYESELGITTQEAINISDHRPISARFRKSGSD
jgi:deoxyribonuclease-1-like protein